MSDSSPTERAKALRNAVAQKAEALRDIDRQRDAAERELRLLEAELEAVDQVTSELRLETAGPSHLAPTTAADKVRLFLSLFRGRPDVFARLWTNSRTGRSGYAPACRNEWVRGICEKPRIRCGECPNQAFLPASDRVMLDHLQGRHVVGVYPLLPDETCWFLAADFDKQHWMEDVAAFREACRSESVPVAVERSRSGCGAHAWFFFKEPVSAAAARRMGCFLITRAMEMHHRLAMSSYDRLFPNQDTMPQGGFGNLIALPLQRGPRAEGNTVFVDDEFRSLADQWAFLAGIQRIPASTIERIAADAFKRGQVLGVRASGDEADDIIAPWHLPPSRTQKPQVPRVDEPVPTVVDATLAQRLYISKEGLPSPVLNALKRLAAFQNPEFYNKQRLRLSTALTPRIIACAEEFPQHVALPRGCTDGAVSLLWSLGATLEIDDQREQGDSIDSRFTGTLTELQEAAVRALLNHDIGVLVAPPGVGKTVAAVQLIAQRARSTLVLVHRQPLLDQWIAQLATFLGVAPASIGRIGGGVHRVTGKVDVAMIQSLVRKDEVAELVTQYGHVVVDECHHIPAVSFERVLSEVRARYVTGLTATPKRRDGQHPIIEMQLGPARYVADSKRRSYARTFSHWLIVRETDFQLPGLDVQRPIQDIYRSLADDAPRNELILADVTASLEAGRSPIVLTERRDHLDFLAERLCGQVRHLVVLRGGASAKRRREVLAELAAIPDDEERLLLATGRYVGEGFDDARLDTLFLTMPVSWRGTLVQYTGRLHRSHPGKADVRIYDYVDAHVPVLARMFKRRLAGYRSLGYEPEYEQTAARTGEESNTGTGEVIEPAQGPAHGVTWAGRPSP